MGLLANFFVTNWLMQDVLAYKKCMKKSGKIINWPQTYILHLAYYF